jgi:DNA-binding HxlR family transcriptional regulator
MIMKDLIKKILKENDDFDWVKQQNPISKEEIASDLRDFTAFGYYVNNPEKSRLVDVIYRLGLDNNTLNTLISVLYDFGESIHEVGSQTGWEEGRREGYDEGYDEGKYDGKGECEDEFENYYEDGYHTGYENGESQGHEKGYKKGYEEGTEKTYYKAFEEGRAYEAGLEVEDLERRESGFDPREYDEDYDENY